jgi:ligand-binding SRPBCC domain-containing protein
LRPPEIGGTLRPTCRLTRISTVVRQFERTQFIPGSASAVWDFFATPRNLDALTPPSVRFKIVGAVPPRMYAGQVIAYRIGLLPGITTGWLTEITQMQDGIYFVDEQRQGPYKLWHHEHHFSTARDSGGVQMIDRVTYDPGWGFLGELVDAWWIRRQLEKIFDYRARKISELFPT